MKRSLLLLLLILYCFESVIGQDLDITQTVVYINRKFRDYPVYKDGSTYTYNIKLSDNGKLYIYENNKYGYEETRIYSTSFFINQVYINSNCLGDNLVSECIATQSSNVGNLDLMRTTLIFFSKTNEKSFYTKIVKSHHAQDQDYTSCFDKIYVQDVARESLCNAFAHLFKLILSDRSYSFTELDSEKDPFAAKNIPVKVVDAETSKSHQKIEEIKLEKNEGGTYSIPATLNDVLKIDFIFDSGASEVSISADVALTLIKTGTIAAEDWLESKSYVFADGSTAKHSRFKLKTFKIGNKEIKNVQVAISGSLNAPLLIGQNVMQRFGKITIDNKREVLIME